MVNENQTKEGAENSAGNIGEGNQSETNSIVDRADAAAERLEKANREKATLLAREEAIIARKALGGQSEGPRQEEKPKELTPKEYAQEVMAGRIPAK